MELPHSRSHHMFRFLRDQSGATAIEYGLIAAATGLALVAVMPLIASGLNATFTSISAAM
jgi:pilus assembly protein Flp/PilA